MADIDKPTIEVDAQFYQDLLRAERAGLIEGVDESFKKKVFDNNLQATSDFIRMTGDNLTKIEKELLRVDPVLKAAKDLRNLRDKLQGN